MKNILVREYLESLTESEELDYIFPILLEVMGFKIISTPKNTKGLAQYGKDIVAIGKDYDEIKKRFYFEVKGGADRNITTTTFTKEDGVRESIIEAKDRIYKDSSNPDFNLLPVKIVVVHNGIIHPSVKETFDGFIEREFPKGNKENNQQNFEFERWDIYQLTELFTNHLFNEYLLTDKEVINHFKKVLVLINTPANNYSDFFQLINFIFNKAGKNGDLSERKRLLFFETLKMISFIVYQYSKDANNLTPALRCIPYLILKLWSWILENGVEKETKIVAHFEKNFGILYMLIEEYFAKTLPVAKLKYGVWSPNGGRYEQVGYPIRCLEYLSYLIFYFECQKQFNSERTNLFEQQLVELITILNNNDGTTRPMFDNHSIPICLTINFLINRGKLEDARSYLRNVIRSIQLAFNTHRRLPDGRSRIESVIRFVIAGQKSIYYEDNTSHLFGILSEYLAVLEMQDEYYGFKKFIADLNIDVAIFVPYDDSQIQSYLPENLKSHELNLFSHELFEEGYQSEIRLDDNFQQFQKKTFEKPVFDYQYKTETVGFPYLLTLAHIYFKTPFFPDYWRKIKISKS